nr:uncharacterized protein LOC127321913 [Lolium perenne]
MAPPLQTTPLPSESTRRCVSSSSSSPSKESSQGPANRAQGRRFSSMAAMLRRRFRPPSSSSGQTEHTTGFLMFIHTSDAISLLLVRPQPSNPPPTRAFRHGCVCPRSSLRFGLKRCVPLHNQHQLPQPSDPAPTGPRPVSPPASSPPSARQAAIHRRLYAAFASSRIGSRSGVVRYDKFFCSFSQVRDDDVSKVTLPAWPGQGYGRHWLSSGLLVQFVSCPYSDVFDLLYVSDLCIVYLYLDSLESLLYICILWALL